MESSRAVLYYRTTEERRRNTVGAGVESQQAAVRPYRELL
jgi:hypothetical protein